MVKIVNNRHQCQNGLDGDVMNSECLFNKRIYFILFIVLVLHPSFLFAATVKNLSVDNSVIKISDFENQFSMPGFAKHQYGNGGSEIVKIDGSQCLKITMGGVNNHSYFATGFKLLKKLDFSDVDRMIFKYKGDGSDNIFRVSLKTQTGNKITTWSWKGIISTASPQWRQVSVKFSDFVNILDANANLSQVKLPELAYIDFELQQTKAVKFPANKPFSFFIDDLVFCSKAKEPKNTKQLIPLHLKQKLEAELIPNGGFEIASPTNPKKPANFVIYHGGTSFQDNEVFLNSTQPFSGRNSLEINTLKSKQINQKMYCVIDSQAGTLYKISYKVKYTSGTGYASISIRSKLKKGNNEFYHVIGNAAPSFAVNKPGKEVDFKAYCYIRAKNPLLVIQSHGPVNVIIDNISITPEHNSLKKWTNWRQQRARADHRWVELDDSLITPHTQWGKPAGYPEISLLSMMRVWQQRWTLELAQRFKIKCKPLPFRSDNGAGSDYWIDDSQGEPTVFKIKEHISNELARQRDCIYIAELKLYAISDWADTILKKVKQGTGLVIQARGQVSWRGVVETHLKVPKEKYFSDQLVKEQLKKWKNVLNKQNEVKPDLKFFDSGSIFMPNVKFYKYGKGRIVYIEGATTIFIKEKNRKDFEAKIAYTMKLLLWASHKQPENYIKDIIYPGASWKHFRYVIQRDEMPSNVKIVFNKVADCDCELDWWVEDKSSAEITKIQGTVALPVGRQSLILPMPKLSTGRHWINMRLKSNKGVVDWKTFDVIVKNNLDIKKIQLTKHDTEYYTANRDTIKGFVELTNLVDSKDYKLVFTLSDADSNVWEKIEINGPFLKKVPFEFMFNRPVVMLHRIKVELTTLDDTVADKVFELCFVRDENWYQNTFQYQIWQLSNYNYINSLVTAEMRKHGINSSFYAASCRQLALNNIRAVERLGTSRNAIKVGGDKLLAPVRNPCLTESDYKQRITADLQKKIKNKIRWAPMGYAVEHEINLKGFSGWMGNADVCFSPSCLNDFSKFIKSEYKDLNVLNSKWQTTYDSWEQIRPMTLVEALKNKSIHRWVDHRRHMDKVWVDSLKYRINFIRRSDANAAGLVDNVLAPDSFSGVDFWRLTNDANITASGIPPKIQTSFTPKTGRFLSLLRYADWHTDQITENKQTFDACFGRGPWVALLSGFNGFTYWTQVFGAAAGENVKQPIMPDLTSTNFANAANKAVERIRDGLDRFVFNGKVDNSSIAILYSRSSIHATYAWQQLNRSLGVAPPPQVNFPFEQALSLQGFSYEIVSDKQIMQGKLKKDSFKVLILPFSQAISDSAAEQIKKFVNDGGILIADLRPAIADEHGVTHREKGSLDDVFGIKQQCDWHAKSSNFKNISLEYPSKMNLNNIFVGPKTHLTEAKAFGSSENIELLVRNKFGKGSAILFNFSTQALTQQILNLIKLLMNESKINPLIKLTFEDSNLIKYNSAKNSIGIADDAEGYMGTLATGNAVIPYTAHISNRDLHIFGLWFQQHRNYGDEKVQIKFPVKGHIYDLKENKYLGKTDNVSSTIQNEGVVVFAITPYKIEKPELKVSCGATNKNVSVFCETLSMPKESAKQNHVIKFSMTAPDGKKYSDFSATVTSVNGKAKYEFLLPLNAPKGNWKIVATESFSKIFSQKEIRIE